MKLLVVLLLVPILTIVNLSYCLSFSSTAPNFLNALEDFFQYRDSRFFTNSLKFQLTVSNITTIDEDSIEIFKNLTQRASLTVSEIFMDYSDPFIPADFKNAFTIMNTDLCIFFSNYTENSTYCDTKEDFVILSKGFDTTMNFI
jgi:hypothetical protein